MFKLEIDPMRIQVHYIIMDLLMYKTQPFVTSHVTYKKTYKKRIICKIDFNNKGIEMINLPRLFRSKGLKSYVNFLNVK